MWIMSLKRSMIFKKTCLLWSESFDVVGAGEVEFGFGGLVLGF